MAGTATNRVLENGSRWFITQHVYFASDGTNESAVIKLDPATYTFLGTHTKLKRIVYNVAPQAGAVRIQWDATSPLDIALLNGFGDYDLRDGVGGPQGIINDAGAGVTGGIKFTTSGLTNTVVGGYTIVLYMIKGT